MASRLNQHYGTKRGKTAYEERLAREKAAKEKADREAAQMAESGKKPPKKLPGQTDDEKKLPFKDSSAEDKTDEKKPPESYKGKLEGTKVSVDGETKKDEDKNKDWAHQKEMQDQAHQNARELQQNSQRFQDEQRQKADAEWYARRDYIRSQKDRSVKWNFRSNSSGGHTSSKWTIDVQRGADRASPGGIGGRITPGENGQIGIAARGPDGKSSLTMNGPSIQGRRIGGGLVDRSGGTNGVDKATLPSFKFSVPFKTNTEAQNLTKDALTDKQLPADVAMREGFLSGDRLAATLETAAAASRNGAKVSIGYGAVQALKPGTKITNEDGTTRESKPGDQEVVNKTITFNPSKWLAIGGTDAAGAVGNTIEEAMTNQRNKTVAALEASDQQKRETLRQHAGDKVSALLASDDPELRKIGQDYAVKQDARITAAKGRAEGAAAQMDSAIKAVKGVSDMMARNQAAASKPFSVSDFTQRKQGRDGKYYDA